MMRLPKFRYEAPESTRRVVELLRDGEALLLAGGTDLLPNMKRRQQMPRVLVGLRRVRELRASGMEAEGFGIGAGVSLAEVCALGEVRARYGALYRAAAQVATPPIRNQATLGGNLCLDTRCNYYNQNLEWRKSIDFCMKAPAKAQGVYRFGESEAVGTGEEKGSLCWVAPGSPRCWAVSSSDTAPALISLNAYVELASFHGVRRIPVADLYRDDGMHYLARSKDELLTKVILPPSPMRSTYWKLRRRGGFDFPVLGVAAAIAMDAKGIVTDARVVLGAIASRPVFDAEVGAALLHGPLSDTRIGECAELAAKRAKPMDNTDFALAWRKTLVKSFVTGVLRELRGDPPETLGVFFRRAQHLPVIV